MAIRQMCSATTDGAVRDEHWSKETKSDIYLRTSHVGVVLNVYERNGYHDSDFYAVVWNDEKGEPEHIEYASTRGWSYPNSASIDASPEVQTKYAAWQQAQAQAARRASERCEAATPTIGKRVRVVHGRKVAIGTEGTVFWYGMATRFGATYHNGYKTAGLESSRMVERLLPPSDGLKRDRRVGMRLDDGSKVFTAATNVEVISSSEACAA